VVVVVVASSGGECRSSHAIAVRVSHTHTHAHELEVQPRSADTRPAPPHDQSASNLRRSPSSRLTIIVAPQANIRYGP